MSGIAGVFRRTGGVAHASEAMSMLRTISHRGPDASASWNDGSVAFGQCMLHTTPESLRERLPRADSSDRFVITADARIDNRSELLAKLAISGPPSSITDSDLILAAYERWGEDCPAELVGDFVFAIWDRPRQRLFLARDAMGVKCVYYYVSNDIVAFGSEIKAVTALPEVPRRLNEVRVLDFLVNIFDDREGTFYRDIVRLAAATSITITRDKVELKRYWTLDPKRELKLRSDAEYTEAFRESFIEAVRCRMRSAFPVGAAVSGGLDSSSIACVARQLAGPGAEVHTFSLVFPDLPAEDLRHIDERSFISHVVDGGGLRPHYVRADRLSPLLAVDRVHHHLDEAFFTGNLYLHWAMYGEARDNNVRVFLDGFDGDTTVSHGFEGLSDLLLSLRWRALSRELNLLATNLGRSRGRLFRDFCLKPISPAWVYTLWHALHGRLHDSRTTATLLREDFKQRLRLDDRVNAMLPSSRRLTSSAREKHWEMLNAALYPHALEVADKAAAAFSVEGRYPFFDRRLVELCLSLPADQKLGQGWTRYILRKAMDGILPREIQYRPGKGNLSPNFYRRLLDGDRGLLDRIILGDGCALQPYLDLDALRRTYARFEADPMRRHDDSIQLFEAVNLALWLDASGITP